MGPGEEDRLPSCVASHMGSERDVEHGGAGTEGQGRAAAVVLRVHPGWHRGLLPAFALEADRAAEPQVSIPAQLMHVTAEKSVLRTHAS